MFKNEEISQPVVFPWISPMDFSKGYFLSMAVHFEYRTSQILCFYEQKKSSGFKVGPCYVHHYEAVIHYMIPGASGLHACHSARNGSCVSGLCVSDCVCQYMHFIFIGTINFCPKLLNVLDFLIS